MKAAARPTGLLKKAQDIRRAHPHLRVLGPHELRVDEEEGITSEEREKILSQIDGAVSEGRLRITNETFQFSARRRGGLLPAVVNIVAVVVVAAGVALALFLSRQQERNIVSPPTAILSAEGKLIADLKAETQAQLQGKDREISSIRQQIAGFDAERAKIKQDAEAQVSVKQKELQDAMNAQLDAERKRLEASGLTEKAVNDRLAALQEKASADMASQLAAFRAKADADSAAKDKAIADLQAQYQTSLSQAQSERAQLQADAAKKQADLEAGYQARQLALQKDTAAAQAELARLRDQQSQQQLMLDQILSWYQKARDQIQAGKPDAALGVLSDFRAYLNSDAVSAVSSVAQRRPVDLFLVDSLEQLVKAQASQAASAADTANLLASANLIAAVAATVQTADQAFQAQGYDRARELYLSALAKIPAVEAGYEKLVQIETIYANQQKKDIAAALATANAAYRAGDYNGAAARYAEALALIQAGDRAAAQALVDQLTAIGAQRKAAEDAALIKSLQGDAAARARAEATIEALRARLSASTSASAQASAARDTVVALLETKLLVQKILLGPDVVKKYPTLYDDLNRYLDALSAQSAADARLETLKDLDSLLAGATGAGQVPDTLIGRYAPSDQQGLLLSVLDRLQALVQ
jgi:hypothetical protein